MNIITGHILAGILAITGYAIPNTIVSVLPEKVYKEGDTLTEIQVKEIIGLYATSTKAYQMLRTVYCESGYKNIQSNIIKNGIREDSWGIAQINLYWNPQISKEQALNPEFAIKFMSDNWGKVKWFGYDRKNDTCNLIYR